MGIAKGPSFIKVMAGNGRIIVETWIKFAALPGVYAGELGIDWKRVSSSVISVETRFNDKI